MVSLWNWGGGELRLEKTHFLNASFERNRRGWQSIEHGAQGVFPTFAGEAPNDGSLMMVAATLGGNPWSGMKQKIKVPEGASTLSFAFQLVHEVTREPGIDPDTVEWGPQKFFVEVESDTGVRAELNTVTGKDISLEWSLIGDSQKCIRINEALYQSQEGVPLCAAWKSGWNTANVDISAYQGEYVTVGFLVKDDGSTPETLSDVQDLYALVDTISVN